MDNFVAIDVETANYQPTSICSIGAVKVIDGYMAGEFQTFVRPEPNWYVRRFTQEIHGISRHDTDSAPLFPEAWAELIEWIGNDKLPFVAHNKRFDEGCIRACFRCYGMDYPDYQFFCTLVQARRTIPRSLCRSFSLPSLCEFLAIPFYNHHDALADAAACARIAMTIL